MDASNIYPAGNWSSVNLSPYKFENKYVITRTQLNATADYVWDKIFYGKNGVETGTLGNPDNTFADSNAKLLVQIQEKYNEMQPRVLTDASRYIDKNIYFIPTKPDGTPLLDTSNVTIMENMFEDCSNLQTIPLLDTSNVTSMEYMFYECTNLQAIPLLDTSKVTIMAWMFVNCTNLQTIPLLDTSKVTNMDGVFYNCSNLSNESLNNILAMCKNAVSYTRTKTLKQLELSQAQATTCQTLSNWSACQAAGWTTGY